MTETQVQFPRVAIVVRTSVRSHAEVRRMLDAKRTAHADTRVIPDVGPRAGLLANDGQGWTLSTRPLTPPCGASRRLAM